MVGREFYGNVQRNSLRKHLRYCRNNICECLVSYMERMEHEVDNRADTMLHADSVQSEMPGHADQVQGRQGGMREAMDMYDDHCRGPGSPAHTPVPQSALDAMNRPIPTVEDWEAEHGRPMPMEPEPGFFSREAFAAATGLTGVALTAYIIVSVGSRLYPPRNFVPIP